MPNVEDMNEFFVDLNDTRLCVETFGATGDPAILLMAGASASMLWWDADLCRRLAGHGRLVIRYDQRDTGRSTTYPRGEPGYSMTDLATDALGILDALGARRAHVVGASMAGGAALILGVDHPDRVASLTFQGTTTGDPELPPMEGTPHDLPANLDDRDALVEYVLESVRSCDGVAPGYDERAFRALIEADADRSTDFAASLINPFRMDVTGPRNGGFADLTMPVLVVHGERDPVFPLPHGEAIAAAAPDAELLELPDAGHDLLRSSWDVYIPALIRHTSR